MRCATVHCKFNFSQHSLPMHQDKTFYFHFRNIYSPAFSDTNYQRTSNPENSHWVHRKSWLCYRIHLSVSGPMHSPAKVIALWVEHCRVNKALLLTWHLLSCLSNESVAAADDDIVLTLQLGTSKRKTKLNHHDSLILNTWPSHEASLPHNTTIINLTIGFIIIVNNHLKMIFIFSPVTILVRDKSARTCLKPNSAPRTFILFLFTTSKVEIEHKSRSTILKLKVESRSEGLPLSKEWP